MERDINHTVAYIQNTTFNCLSTNRKEKRKRVNEKRFKTMVSIIFACDANDSSRLMAICLYFSFFLSVGSNRILILYFGYSEPRIESKENVLFAKKKFIRLLMFIIYYEAMVQTTYLY